MHRNDMGLIVLPPQTTFVLPRNIASAVLQVGERLLKLDPASGNFVKNDPSATKIAMVLFDDDQNAADAFLAALVSDYNAYVQAATQAPGITPFFVP
jgi:hypothetical protein